MNITDHLLISSIAAISCHLFGLNFVVCLAIIIFGVVLDFDHLVAYTYHKKPKLKNAIKECYNYCRYDRKEIKLRSKWLYIFHTYDFLFLTIILISVSPLFVGAAIGTTLHFIMDEHNELSCTKQKWILGWLYEHLRGY